MSMSLGLSVALVAAALAGNAPLRAPSDDATGRDVVPRIATLAEPGQTYSVFLPADGAPSQRWPVLILLDARGRCEGTLRRVEAAARRNRWLVLSSCNSQSDVDETVTLRALQALLREVGQRYPYDPRRIYLGGFSGTAKTLWTQVGPLRRVIAGVFGSGGGRPPELGAMREAPPAFFGTTGTNDFNYQEMHALDADLAGIGATRRLEVFDGTHDWPPADLFGEVLDWFDLVAMRDGRMPRDDAWIAAQFEVRRARASASVDVLAQWRALDQLVRDFTGLRDVESLRAEAQVLAESPGLRERRAQETRLQRAEQGDARRLEAWIARQQSRDPASGRINDPPTPAVALRELRVPALRQQARDPDPAIAASASRRLERISVAVGFYLPQRYAGVGDHPRAAAMLAIAIALHPQRAALHWRLAAEYARMRKVDQAFDALAQARRLGFVDVEALAGAEWDGLRDDPRWPAASAPLP